MKILHKITRDAIYENGEMKTLIDADLRGADLRGANLIDADLRFIIIHGSRHTLVAHKDGLQVGCKIKDWSWWTKENINELGESEDYTPNQIAEYQRHIGFARATFEKDISKENP